MSEPRRKRRRSRKSTEAVPEPVDRPRVRVTLDPPGIQIGGAGLGFEVAASEAAALLGDGAGAQMLGGEVRQGVLEVSREGTTFDQMMIAFPGSRLVLDGRFRSRAGAMRGDLHIEAQPLDLDDLLERLDVLGTERSARARGKRGKRAPWPDLDAELTLRQVRFRGLVAERAEGRLSVEGGRCRFAPLSIRTGGGTLEGSVEGPVPGALGPVHVEGRLSAPEVKPILGLAGVPVLVSGSLDADLDVTVARGKSWRSGGRGRFRIDLGDGRLHAVRVVGEVLAPLVPSVVSGMLSPLSRLTESSPLGRLAEFEAFGTHFDRLILEGTLANGRIDLDEATLEAFGMTAELVGGVDAATGALDLRGTVRVESALLERIGIETASMFSVPVAVRGSLRAPRILPDLDELRALAGRLELRSLPGKLLGDVNMRLRSFADRARGVAAEEPPEPKPAPPPKPPAKPPAKRKAPRKKTSS